MESTKSSAEMWWRMRVIILAAGQGTRLRPLTDDKPKCMVEVNGKSIIERQLSVMYNCGIREEDITIVADILRLHPAQIRCLLPDFNQEAFFIK